MGTAANNNFPVIVAIVPLINQGALAAIQSDWYRSGEMCADKAEMVLSGKKANSIPIEFSDRVDIGINVKVADKLGIKIPYNIIESASEVVDK